MDSYDAIPYESTPFHETHPAFLAPLARLFGVQAAPPERCRVLEIGCASGGNLIPMAWHLRESEFVGIELSAGQAAEGAAFIERLGLGNITIRGGDVLEFGAQEGVFDYIIAHGVYSWAPPAVREKILALCRDHLAPNGVAYISYNTLPGWRMRGMLRDILLHHVRDLTAPAERLAAAQELLAFFDPLLAGLDSAHSHYLRYEIERIGNNHPSYLYHEYLEETNEPFLFSRFVADARRFDLEYLGDTEIHTLFPESLGDEVALALERFTDPIERWQHLDFLTNRNFRQSLLCRAEREVMREPDLDAFAGFAFGADLRPPKRVDLGRIKETPFTAADGSRCAVLHPLTKAALAHLGAVFPATVGFDELVARSRQAVQAAGNRAHAEEVEHLMGELFGLYARQVIIATLGPESRFGALSERPEADALVRMQAAAGLGHVATPRHLTVRLDPFSTRLLGYLDGRHTREAILARLLADAQALPELQALGGDGDRARLEKSLAANAERLLALFARQGLLVG